jgi:mRNA-degrading endonuclease toxin of MazEF toxin-antitoxin module
VIVMSHDGFNQSPGWKSMIVIPISTSASQGRRGPTVVALPAGAYGTGRHSFAVCHQVTTLDRAKLLKKAGTLGLSMLREVEGALKAALDLD